MSIFNLKFSITCLSSLFILFTSCKKEIADTNYQTELTQKEIEIKWAESHSGRWYSYAIEEIRAQSQKIEIDTMQYMQRILSVTTNAKLHYKNLLLSRFKKSITTTDIDSYLDSMYSEIYSEMDKNMQDTSYMKRLFSYYEKLPHEPPNRLRGVSKLSSISIDEVRVTRCGIPYEVVDLNNRLKRFMPPLYEFDVCRASASRDLNYLLQKIYSYNGSNCRYLSSQAANILFRYEICMRAVGGARFSGPNPDLAPPTGGGGGSSSNGKPSQGQIANQIANKPFALISNIPCEIIRQWLATATRQIQQSTYNRIESINDAVYPNTDKYTGHLHAAWIQNINSAYSTVVNMDYFPIRVQQLPIIGGQRLTATQFLEYIRKNINTLVDTEYSSFEPYNYPQYNLNDAQRWASNNYLNTVINIDIKGPDNGSVIVTRQASDGWTFTTLYEPRYADHPVSGNRDFGYVQNTDGSYTFYTRGVDRLTQWDGTFIQKLSETITGEGYAFKQADALWTSFQNMIAGYVNQRGGSASVVQPEIYRPDWQRVKDVIDGKKPLSTLSTDCK